MRKLSGQILTHFLGQSSVYIDSMNLSEWHIYGSSRLGIYQTSINMAYRNIRITGGVTTQETTATVAMPSYTLFAVERGAKRYELTNHLGNVLVVVSDKKIQVCSTSVVSYYIADVVNANDYSAFGAPLAGRTFTAPNISYRFAFNGKELDNETFGKGNAYDFGARIYDSRLGRWLSVDPKYKQFPCMSPYVYTDDNPIFYIDPDGKSGIASIDKENHKITIKSTIIFYGVGASNSNTNNLLAKQDATNIQNQLNEIPHTAMVDGECYDVQFEIESVYLNEKDAEVKAKANKDVCINFMRLNSQTTKPSSASAKKGVGGNSFNIRRDESKTEKQTTATHEFCHGLGLEHPVKGSTILGLPGIMTTIFEKVDPIFTKPYQPKKGPITTILNKDTRKVLQSDIDALKLDVLFKDKKDGASVNIGIVTNTIYKADGTK